MARVLVIDDQELIRHALAEALRDEGFATLEAGNGHAAERAFAEFKPDLVVLDVTLPDVDGFELARGLGRSGHNTPVIFLSDRHATEDKVAALALADDYVTK